MITKCESNVATTYMVTVVIGTITLSLIQEKCIKPTVRVRQAKCPVPMYPPTRCHSTIYPPPGPSRAIERGTGIRGRICVRPKSARSSTPPPHQWLRQGPALPVHRREKGRCCCPSRGE